MSFQRLLNPQGIAGIVLSLALGLLLLIQKGETRHWKAESARFEHLYRNERSAFATTVADYRAAAEGARAAQLAAAERVAAQQQAINQRSQNDLEARLADARTRAEQLRLQSRVQADPSPRADAPVPGLPAAAGGPAHAAGHDQLPPADALIATEQAIQLDELIKWVRAQAAVDMNARPVASPADDTR